MSINKNNNKWKIMPMYEERKYANLDRKEDRQTVKGKLGLLISINIFMGILLMNFHLGTSTLRIQAM